MLEKLKTLLIGRSLPNSQLHGEKMNVFWGLPILASDAISSVAYAGEEILLVLFAVLGAASYKYMFMTVAAVVLLLFILVVSYRQTIDHYPNGGGSYTVAKENLGEIPGLIACASLVIGYVLTVAVSASAGTAAVVSALPVLAYWKVPITLLMILLMTLGNLRGVRESARIFAVPTYVFIASMLLLIVVGVVRARFMGYAPAPLYPVPQAAGDVTLFLMVRAFAAGCAGLTGVEAVSNAIPSFVEPSQKNAKRVLSWLALLVLAIFGGSSYLATHYSAVPGLDNTVLSQIGEQVFGKGVLYYVLQISTTVILVMAANTSYAGLPLLLSLAARDAYMPRQFNTRGGRLSYSNGIIALSVAAGVLVLVYGAETHKLVPLYAIGVFISFTLSQMGMLRKWVKERGRGWGGRALVNGLGLVMTFLTVLIIAYSKMAEGAWISLVCIIVLIVLMKVTNAHYKNIARQLRLTAEEVKAETQRVTVSKRMIVLVNSLNKASLKAVNYARQISCDKDIIAFNVSLDKEQAKTIRDQWKKYDMPIPLVVRYSPHRDLMGTLMKYVRSEEYDYQPEDVLTLVMPQFIVKQFWMNVYHSQSGYMIRHKLMHDPHIAIIIVPYVLE